MVTVRFIATSGFVGRSIRWVTNGLFQHCEFGTSEGTWIGAHWQDGVQERPANYCTPYLNYIYDIPSTDFEQTQLLTWARSKIGTKYNLLDIAGLMVHAKSLNSPQRLICSEFCTDGLLRTFGPYRVLNVLLQYSYLVTPEMLHLSPIFTGNRRKLG